EMSALISSASACQRFARSRSPCSSARRAPRSHATQHMSFDEVKCWGSPRTSQDRKSTRLNSSHGSISYAVFCLKKKKKRKSVIGGVSGEDSIDEPARTADLLAPSPDADVVQRRTSMREPSLCVLRRRMYARRAH